MSTTDTEQYFAILEEPAIYGGVARYITSDPALIASNPDAPLFPSLDAASTALSIVPPTHTLVQNGDISTKPRPYSYNRNGTFSNAYGHGLAIVIPVENFTERNYPLGRHDSLLATFRETLALNPNAPGPIFHCTTLHDARSFAYTIRKDHGLRYTVIEDPDTHLFRIAPTAEPLPKVSLKPKKKKPTKTSLTRTHLDPLLCASLPTHPSYLPTLLSSSRSLLPPAPPPTKSLLHRPSTYGSPWKYSEASYYTISPQPNETFTEGPILFHGTLTSLSTPPPSSLSSTHLHLLPQYHKASSDNLPALIDYLSSHLTPLLQPPDKYTCAQRTHLLDSQHETYLDIMTPALVRRWLLRPSNRPALLRFFRLAACLTPSILPDRSCSYFLGRSNSREVLSWERDLTDARSTLKTFQSDLRSAYDVLTLNHNRRLPGFSSFESLETTPLSLESPAHVEPTDPESLPLERPSERPNE